MNDEILIRPVRHDDFAKWKVLWDGYNAFYGRKGSTALPETITTTTWSRFFDGYEPIHALIAGRAGQLLGLVHSFFIALLLPSHQTAIWKTCSPSKQQEVRGWGVL
jgi:hypothetical protein